MAAVALPWLVLTSTGSPAKTGIVAAAELVPTILVGIPSSWVAARLGPLKTMLLCDGARAPLALAVPALYWLGWLPFGALVLLAAAMGVFIPAHLASQRTLLPELVGESQDDVGQANAVLQAATRLPLSIAPAIAGVLVGLIGAPTVLVLDAATFGISFVLLLRLLQCFDPVRRDVPISSTGLLAGVRVVARDRLLGSVTVANAVVEFAMQMVFLSLPILAYTRYDGHVSLSAALFTAWSIGTLLGMPAARRLAKRDAVQVLRAGLVAQALPLWLLAADAPPVALGVALLLSGVANPIANAPSNTIMTLGVRDDFRQQAMGAFVTCLLGAGGVGLVAAGPLAEHTGPHGPLLVAAASTSVCAAAFALSTRRIRLEAPPSA